jgi:metal-responsive CopG/Arc/MetJ family transcriptional regulator
MQIGISLNDELASELTEAAKTVGVSPRQFAVEAVESVLASRRLERLPAAPLGARMTVAEEVL